MHFKHLG